MYECSCACISVWAPVCPWALCVRVCVCAFVCSCVPAYFLMLVLCCNSARCLDERQPLPEVVLHHVQAVDAEGIVHKEQRPLLPRCGQPTARSQYITSGLATAASQQHNHRTQTPSKQINGSATQFCESLYFTISRCQGFWTS